MWSARSGASANDIDADERGLMIGDEDGLDASSPLMIFDRQLACPPTSPAPSSYSPKNSTPYPPAFPATAAH